MIIYMYVGGEYVDETKFLMKDVVNTFAFVWMLMKHDEKKTAWNWHVLGLRTVQHQVQDNLRGHQLHG